MSVEQALSIIKPDGVQKNLVGEIVGRFEKAGLEIIAARMIHLSREQAEEFYAVHKERPFFDDLVSYMMSGPVMVLVLQGDSAINANRKIMGATNPADAELGTIRADFAESIEENIVHGSDGPDTALQEIAFFFGDGGICPRTRQDCTK
ncbi:MAG: nucleoside-diphosphate kinase [Proteobacteria bacterium]|nr:nucleoside-diphosphate kinase [Pseudomonadota bacterium]